MKKLISLIRAVAIACGIVATGSNSANADVLGVPVFAPKVNALAVGGSCSFNAGTQTLTITGVPDQVEFDAAATNIGFIDFGALTISANINAGGTLVGGTFTLNGETTDFNTFDFFASPLLTGNIVAYGIDAPGTTDKIDFRIQPTGGSLLARFAPGDQIAAVTTLEGSTFGGSFSANWGCTTPKTIVGSTPPAVQETCALSLAKTANPTTIGPILPPSGHDKPDDSDVDSHRDRNNDGDSDSEDDDGGGPVNCGCKGKVSELTLKYNGSVAAQVIVTRKPPFSTLLFQGTVQPGAEFTVMASSYGPPGISGTLGTNIEIAIDGGASVEMHTSCSQPIGPGLVAGDFEVVSGKSKKLAVPLCPIVTGGCPANQQVVYTYILTNSGSTVTNVTVDDDKLGNISSGTVLNGGQSATFTKSACLFQTTTNMATAAGSLPSGSNCAAAPASATVTLIIPPPPPPPGCTSSDSDSDSGADNNANGDSDDSDGDSGPQDCDQDGDPPPPPGGGNNHGCPSDHWKKYGHKWKSFKHGDKFGAVFGVQGGGNRSMKDALDSRGGGAKGLEREAAAALLNASDPNMNYFYSAAEVKAIVKNAHNTKDYDTAIGLLKQQNNCGCPSN